MVAEVRAEVEAEGEESRKRKVKYRRRWSAAVDDGAPKRGEEEEVKGQVSVGLRKWEE